jgi:hypothetical protein
MFPGLPSLTMMGAITPTVIPVRIIPHRDEKKRLSVDIFQFLSIREVANANLYLSS